MKLHHTLWLATLLTVPTLSWAEEVRWGLRGGPMIGTYQGDAKATARDGGGNVVGSPIEIKGDTEFAYGLLAGGQFGWNKVFAALDLELQEIQFNDQDINRTDVVFSAGYLLTDLLSAFAGYRRGWQGDGYFDDDIYNESGPFIGAGIRGVKAGDAVSLGGSISYNFNTVEDLFVQGKDFDYGGLSLKGTLTLDGTPHSFQLRYQRFDGDDRIPVEGGSVDVELTENYVNLAYIYSWAP